MWNSVCRGAHSGCYCVSAPDQECHERSGQRLHVHNGLDCWWVLVLHIKRNYWIRMSGLTSRLHRRWKWTEMRRQKWGNMTKRLQPSLKAPNDACRGYRVPAVGIFNVSIPVIYDEGNRFVRRFLEHILVGFGDVIILSWTGCAGGYNSCLPPDLTVYDQPVPPHIQQPIEAAEMDATVMALRSSLPDLYLALELYNHLNKPLRRTFTTSRLGLPCITFAITNSIPRGLIRWPGCLFPVQRRPLSGGGDQNQGQLI